eukprot:TRINITY_DN1741_c0_g1_i1.p1 TRINITY_DN1741_c0_g1~~TRINITY_DN1741_c0_g1_i1.p1  ORF type:complete len:344 (+),score=82.38 TRINITY_DN1741_c0_g1_i1:31-1062(+)
MNVVIRALLCIISILVGFGEGQARVSFSLQGDGPNSPVVVNGVQMPELTFKRNERYSLENEIPAMTLCIQTPDAKKYEYGLPRSCIRDEPVVWRILESTPETLYYTFLERPEIFVKIHIVDQAPKFRIWYKSDLLSPGSTISYEFSSFPATLVLDLVNSGDDPLHFPQQPLLSSAPQSPYWPPELPTLPSALPPDSYLPYSLTFEAPFSGTISWVSNDVYASYTLSFYITCSCWDDGSEVEVMEVPLLPNDASGLVSDLKENNYNPLMVFLVVPALSLLTVCGTVLLMGVMLGKKEEEVDDGLVELQEKNAKKGEMKRELVIKREALGDPFSEDEVSSTEEQN